MVHASSKYDAPLKPAAPTAASQQSTFKEVPQEGCQNKGLGLLREKGVDRGCLSPIPLLFST